MTDRNLEPTHARAGGVWNMPYLLLMMPPLIWSSNFIVGRAVVGHVPPVGLAFWRWFIGFLILLALSWRPFLADLSELRRRWRILVVLSATGIAVFNTFVYVGLNSTTALNGVMMQSIMPVLIVLMSFMLFGVRVSLVQGLGILLSLAGVLTIIARGDWGVLAGLSLDFGDVWIFAAVVSYAVYTALLTRRPAVRPLSFLTATFGLGALMLLPFHLWESLALGLRMQLDLPTVGAAVYVAIFPSILAYLCFNRVVELIGPNRAGLSIHLMPVFGSLMAILFLGERFQWFHAVGIALIALGIAFASRRRR